MEMWEKLISEVTRGLWGHTKYQNQAYNIIKLVNYVLYQFIINNIVEINNLCNICTLGIIL